MGRSRAFTLIEMMIVVVILGVVAVLAIVSYGRYIRKSTKAEVVAMLGEIRAKEEAYLTEWGNYKSSNAALDETVVYPALLGAAEFTTKAFNPPAGDPWRQLGVNPPRSALYCGYVAVASDANGQPVSLTPLGYTPPAGGAGVTLFTNVPKTGPGGTIQQPWFYARACCDMSTPRGGASCPPADANLSIYQISNFANTMTEENDGQ